MLPVLAPSLGLTAERNASITIAELNLIASDSRGLEFYPLWGGFTQDKIFKKKPIIGPLYHRSIVINTRTGNVTYSVDDESIVINTKKTETAFQPDYSKTLISEFVEWHNSLFRPKLDVTISNISFTLGNKPLPVYVVELGATDYNTDYPVTFTRRPNALTIHPTGVTNLKGRQPFPTPKTLNLR